MTETKNSDSLRFRQDAQVRLLIEKNPGEMDYRCEINASSTTAAYYGLALVIKELSERSAMSLDHTVAVLATILLAPAAQQTAEGDT